MKLLFSLALTNLFIFVSAQPPLLTRFPTLKESIPYISFCNLPTPIERLNNFGTHLQLPHLFIKRDDLTGTQVNESFRLYGGNKPRKLEFLLADARSKNAETIITYGCAGSNHALATAVYAYKLGFKPILMLKHQPNSRVVQHNLLLDLANDATIQYFPNNTVRSQAAAHMLANDPHAYLIPTGGSNAIGVLGFVNAALELAEQIKNNEMPEPDFIYVATGSCATTAGLLLGSTIAGLSSKIVGICVEPEDTPDEFLHTITTLFKQTNEHLHAVDASIPLYEFPLEQLILNKNFCGTAYGLFIPEAVDAIKTFKELEGIKLEGTYSAKPIAAITDDAHNGIINKDHVVLFWNTYCGIDYSSLCSRNDYKKLPEELHIYFESEVQPLDIL